MKIIFSNTPLEKSPSSFIPVKITEGKLTRLIQERGRDALEIGAGPWNEMTRRKFILLCRKIIFCAKQNKIKRLAIQFDRSPFPKLKDISLSEISRRMAENFEMANFEFVRFKTKPKEGWDFVEEILICGETSREMKDGFKKGQSIGKEINACRELANTPGGNLSPRLLAQKAREAVRGLLIKVKILDEKAMRKIGMGAVLGVGKGSPERPKFIILEYFGGKKGEAPIVLVGKGVTFDSGGLSLKPSDSMIEMHLDMSGGAAVIHTIALAAKLKVRQNMIALIPAVENMIGGESYRPGDILSSLSGKTIEVLNTDAEGRIILADALTYAERYKPKLVVDVATLTGASLIALGEQASAILTKEDALASRLQELGEESGDYVWPLPLWDEFEEGVKGTFGDVSNIPAKGNTRHAGVIHAGMFLYQFAKNYRWVHIDMAPKMTSTEGEYLAKGASGAPMRLLLKIVETF